MSSSRAQPTRLIVWGRSLLALAVVGAIASWFLRNSIVNIFNANGGAYIYGPPPAHADLGVDPIFWDDVAAPQPIEGCYRYRNGYRYRVC